MSRACTGCRCLAAVAALGAAPAVPAHVPDFVDRVASPLFVLEKARQAGVTPLAVDLDVYDALEPAGRVVLEAFPLDAATRVDLDLHRFEVLAPDAQIVVGTPWGDVPLPRPEVVLLRGSVCGRPDSSVFLGLTPRGANGFIETPDSRHIIAGGTGGPTVIYDVADVPAGLVNVRPFTCGADELMAPPARRAGGAEGAGGGGGCGTVALLALETDWEFTELFGGETALSTAYAETLIGAVSTIFERDVDKTLLINFLRVWDSPSDPWTRSDTVEQLFEFQDYWNVNMQEVERHAAHFLSGPHLTGAGGVAYVPGLCQADFDYGLSAMLNGSFPLPLEDNHEQNWDVVVVAHELGHNFGAPHTHDMNPPVDTCGFGECAEAPNGTLMSYCHLCDPVSPPCDEDAVSGLCNIALIFHERSIDEWMLPFLETPPCNFGASELLIVTQPQGATVCEGAEFTLVVEAESDLPLSYQWLLDEVEISGATNATYMVAAATINDEGAYTCVVSSSCEEVTTGIATIVLDTNCACPLIETQPVGNTICAGGSHTFTVTATGGALVYEWFKDGQPVGGGGPSLAISSASLGDSGDYTVVVSNTCGSQVSDPATLVVEDCTPSCPWDTDRDGLVGVVDLLVVLGNWGGPGPGDFDNNGIVSITDLLKVLGQWGPCP